MTELKIIKLSDIQAEPVNWLWEPYIPYGMITHIQGDGGLGKSTLMRALATAITTGKSLPGQGSTVPASVIMQNAEDSYSQKIKPELELFGADCDMIHVIDTEEKALSFADERIEQTIIKTGTKLLILDPIQAYFGGANMNNAGSVRPLMSHLGKVANRHQCAVILVGHLGKEGRKAAYRTLGSTDIYATARSVLTVGQLELDESMRAFVQIKNNMTSKGNPQAFALDGSGAFCWLGECDATIEEFDGKTKKTENQFAKARRLIETALAKGPVLAVDMEQMAEDEGISTKTFYRAKAALGVISVRPPGQKQWYWEIPIEVEHSEVGQDGQHGQDGQQRDGHDSTLSNLSNMTALSVLPEIAEAV